MFMCVWDIPAWGRRLRCNSVVTYRRRSLQWSHLGSSCNRCNIKGSPKDENDQTCRGIGCCWRWFCTCSRLRRSARAQRGAPGARGCTSLRSPAQICSQAVWIGVLAEEVRILKYRGILGFSVGPLPNSFLYGGNDLLERMRAAGRQKGRLDTCLGICFRYQSHVCYHHCHRWHHPASATCLT